MNDLERRLRSARPLSSHREAPLTDRARSDFEKITGAALLPDEDNSEKPKLLRTRVLASAGATILLVCAGVVMFFMNPAPLQHSADPEGQGTPEASSSVEPYFDSVEALAESSDLIARVTVEPSAANGMFVVEVLAGDVPIDEPLQVRELDVALNGEYTIALDEIDADSLILFLTATKVSGEYELVNAAQSVFVVEGGSVYALFDELDLGTTTTLDQLRDQLITTGR